MKKRDKIIEQLQADNLAMKKRIAELEDMLAIMKRQPMLPIIVPVVPTESGDNFPGPMPWQPYDPTPYYPPQVTPFAPYVPTRTTGASTLIS